MRERKTRCRKRKRAEQEARKLLRSPRFFNEFLLAMKKAGLVGEELNALVLLVVAVSRVLPRPLNLFVKGRSSTGKNWLVTRLLRLMPKSAVAEVTSASDKAWHYSRSDFRHRVVYLQEQNEAAGNIHPIRLLISEGKLIRIVPGYENGKRVTTRHVARGPVAAISTTTKNRLEIDDETRHISIWVDESRDQTRRIVKSYGKESERLSRKKLRAWHMVQRLLERRVGTRVTFPKWFEKIADRLFVDDVRVRRYYPAFVEACRTVCLIRSFQPHRELTQHGRLEIDFADFAITALIFDPVFVESLHLDKAAGEATRRLVDEISARKKRPVEAKDIARKLDISMDQAYRKLSYAAQVGVIRRVNKHEKNNRKTYLSAPRPRFVPDPKQLFRELRDLREPAQFVHPVTGEWVSKLVAIFDSLDFSANRAEGDDLLGDAYEYLMRHFATESGKSKGQFYTPAEVSRIMAKVVGIGSQIKPSNTVYDPTCGSGSLLLKAADEAPHGMSIYGQENDVATWALARMNMFLHNCASHEIWRGNTLSAPHFKDNSGQLKTFDFAVANPPFSAKAWTSGLNPEKDEFHRFEYGIPPAKNGDYAFLLHLIKSLKSNGNSTE